MHLNLADESRMSTPIGNCQVKTSTIFVFGTPTSQTASNGIYLNKRDELTSSTQGTLGAGKNHDVKLLFNSDYERMQYLLGKFGRSSQGLQ